MYALTHTPLWRCQSCLCFFIIQFGLFNFVCNFINLVYRLIVSQKLTIIALLSRFWNSDMWLWESLIVLRRLCLSIRLTLCLAGFTQSLTACLCHFISFRSPWLNLVTTFWWCAMWVLFYVWRNLLLICWLTVNEGGFTFWTILGILRIFILASSICWCRCGCCFALRGCEKVTNIHDVKITKYSKC